MVESMRLLIHVIGLESTLPVLPWRYPKMTAEGTGEIPGIAVANPIRDQLDLKIGVQQQAPPPLQAHLLQI
ncbi:MAG: hypothetical protein V2I45_09280, partial [Halieaceae bacterium]|nr:hypothetical protein [Halieaceae bacterium]